MKNQEFALFQIQVLKERAIMKKEIEKLKGQFKSFTILLATVQGNLRKKLEGEIDKLRKEIKSKHTIAPRKKKFNIKKFIISLLNE